MNEKLMHGYWDNVHKATPCWDVERIIEHSEAIEYDHQIYGNHHVIIGSGAMLTFIRYAICKNIIPFDEIEFFYNGEKIEHTANGRLVKWPSGLDDYLVEWMAGII